MFDRQPVHKFGQTAFSKKWLKMTEVGLFSGRKDFLREQVGKVVALLYDHSVER
jgi:hypothetical protein